MGEPSLTPVSKTTTTVTVRLNGDFDVYSFAINGGQTRDVIYGGGNLTKTATFTNLTPNTTYTFGILDNERNLVPDSEIRITTFDFDKVDPNDPDFGGDKDGGFVFYASSSGSESGLSDGARIAIIFGSIIGFLMLAYAYNRYL